MDPNKLQEAESADYNGGATVAEGIKLGRFFVTARRTYEFTVIISAPSLEAAQDFARANEGELEEYSSADLVSQSLTVDPVEAMHLAIDDLRSLVVSRGEPRAWVATATREQLLEKAVDRRTPRNFVT